MRLRSLLLLLATLLFAPLATATGKSTLTVSEAYTYETAAPGVPAGGYLRIRNSGKVADRLVSASSPLASSVEIHQMSMAGGVMRMRALPEGLAVPAGKTVALAPGALHLMLFGPTQPFAQGQKVPLVLNFQKAGKVEVQLEVKVREAEAEAHANH